MSIYKLLHSCSIQLLWLAFPNRPSKTDNQVNSHNNTSQAVFTIQTPQNKALRRKYEGVSFRMRSSHWVQSVWNKHIEHSKAENLELQWQISSTGYWGTKLALLSFRSHHIFYMCMLNMTDQTRIKGRESGMDALSWYASAAVPCACDWPTMKSIHHAAPLNRHDRRMRPQFNGTCLC